MATIHDPYGLGGTTSGGYTCHGCGGYVRYGEIHSCPYPTTIATTTAGIPMKHILWQEYIPARPPIIGGNYLIVYVDSAGCKTVARGSFEIDSTFQHKWYDESFIQLWGLVTHFAKIELP
jgi:hypothetical protein